MQISPLARYPVNTHIPGLLGYFQVDANGEFTTPLLPENSAASNEIEFSVRDYGPGIPRHQMKKVFSLFYRAENELIRETVGTGIGLALVNQLMRDMGGKLKFENTNPGARFILSFKTL